MQSSQAARPPEFCDIQMITELSLNQYARSAALCILPGKRAAELECHTTDFDSHPSQLKLTVCTGSIYSRPALERIRLPMSPKVWTCLPTLSRPRGQRHKYTKNRGNPEIVLKNPGLYTLYSPRYAMFFLSHGD